MSPSDSDSFRSDDGRVEVVSDLEPFPETEISVVLKAAVAALDSETFTGPDRITVMITGDDQIRNLNREFKGEDAVTDVLSFNEAGDGDSVDEDWPTLNEQSGTEADSGRLGDIAISLPQVVRQAAENGTFGDRELAMLTIHGVFHLLGYDHAEVDEEKVMFGKTDVVLAEIFGE